MYRKPADRQPASDVSPWLASILMRRDGRALTRFAVYFRQLSAMPRRWRRQLRRRVAVGLSSAALVLALVGPMAAAPAQPAAPDATIFVVNGEVADDQNNKCSLIEAIINARTVKPIQMRADCATGNVNGPDTVSLPSNGTFVLTQVHNTQLDGDTALPVINSAVTIDGHGSTIHRTEEGNYGMRVLAVDANGALTLRDTTISNGWGRFMGGGILSYGTLTVVGSTITGNYAPEGGGIHSRGTLTLVDSTVSNNRGEGDPAGGGVFANGPTTITNSVIINNDIRTGRPWSQGGGVAIWRDAQATITGSTIAGNQVEGYYRAGGAGIYVYGEATISDTVISGNINFGDSTGGHGGGVGVGLGGHVTITNSLIRDNEVRYYGDEGYNYWELEMGFGGGLNNLGHAVISNTTITGNEAGYGGGVANARVGVLTITHSTITDNRATQEENPDEDRLYGGYGGGIHTGWQMGYDNCSTTTVQGTVVSGNTAVITGPQVYADTRPESTDECYGYGAFNVNAFNVFGQANNHGLVGLTPGATDVVPSVGLAAILSPLADNGGPTLTHALPAGSPALDLAPNASCTAAPVNGVDQRGEPRNQNGAGGVTGNECDAGAFEIEDNGDVLLALAAKQNVPGAGLVQPQDVLRFVPTSTGNTTAGSFTLEVDGSANLLTTAGEKIDALGRTNGRLAISTIDVAVVKRPDMTTLKAQDEDALGFNPVNGQWSEFFNGTSIPGLKVEDVNGLWIDTATGDLYVTIVGAFNVAGVAGNGRDIVKLSPDAGAPGGYTAALFWDGSDAGFPVAIDGLEMAP